LKISKISSLSSDSIAIEFEVLETLPRIGFDKDRLVKCFKIFHKLIYLMCG